MRISAHFTSRNDDVTILVAINAGRARTRVKGVAGLQRTAALI